MKRLLFKCFNLGFNYPKDQSLTDLVYKCIDLIENCPNVSVKINQHWILIKTPNSEIALWNENKFYAWFCNVKVNGKYYKYMRPSLNAMYDFKEFLKKKGYDIYLEDVCNEPEQSILKNIDEIKC